jgi:hypothetical protein
LVLLREKRSIKLRRLHLDLLHVLLNSMILLNNLVHEFLEGIVRVMAAGINSNS